MDDRIYDYWVATIQDGYLGSLIDMVDSAGGARAFYEMTVRDLVGIGISERLAGYINDNKPDIGVIEEDYGRLSTKGISYVNHADDDFPEKLRNIASTPYGLFVKGRLPDPLTPSVAIIGARECSEYGRLMAEYFGDRLVKEGIQIISGMAWGIDGISQAAAIAAGGRSFAILGCGVDIAYPAKNRILYNRLCKDDNGIISEYAPGSAAQARRFPPRNRIISALSDVVMVVEARAKSGTLITVDMAIDQGKTVMVVPGRLTDNLSVGCLNLLYQGALPATSVEAVLEQLNMGKPKHAGKAGKQSAPPAVRPVKVSNDNNKISDELSVVANVLSIEPQSTESIANAAHLSPESTLIILTRLELEGLAREVWPGYFIRKPELA